MAKNISIADEAYEFLSQEKQPRESFTDVILRLAHSNLKISEVAGTHILTREQWREVEKELEKREHLNKRRKKRVFKS